MEIALNMSKSPELGAEQIWNLSYKPNTTQDCVRGQPFLTLAKDMTHHMSWASLEACPLAQLQAESCYSNVLCGGHIDHQQ